MTIDTNETVDTFFLLKTSCLDKKGEEIQCYLGKPFGFNVLGWATCVGQPFKSLTEAQQISASINHHPDRYPAYNGVYTGAPVKIVVRKVITTRTIIEGDVSI